jgi:uncharacterized protein (TIGR04255 family)
MAINEVFSNPTVKQVIFQIRFPNLFYIENKIGDLQLKIMKEFPISTLLFRKSLIFVEAGSETKLKTPEDTETQGQKIWQFESPKNYKLNILNNSLDITSEYHKTYKNKSSENRFEDIIKFVLDNFFEIVQIPIINRIGLRYIDECPIPNKDNETFNSMYNTTFPIERFNLADALEMQFRTVSKRGNHFLIYSESLKKVGDNYKLILDYDGFSNNIDSKDYLKIADDLHTLISDEYQRTIKQPVFDYMRTTRS